MLEVINDSFSFWISLVRSRFVLERGVPTSLGLRRRMGETGVVCSSVRANSSKTSGEVLGVCISKGIDVGGGGALTS